MSYPGYILDIPLDFQEHPDRYRGSANFISFAIEQGWYDPHSHKPFNVNQIYQEGKGRQETVRVIEERLRQKVKAGKLTLREFMDTVRDPLISKDWNGYGQVAHLRQGIPHPELNMLWVAATGSITTPFVPYWIGVDKVIPEFGKHRYLSHRPLRGDKCFRSRQRIRTSIVASTPRGFAADVFYAQRRAH
jgi:hypothetical protein